MHRPATKEEVEELQKDLLLFLGTFRDPERRKASIRGTLKAGWIAAAVGSAIGGLAALGQALALGPARAWLIYGKWWLVSPLIAVGALAGMFSLVLLVYVLPVVLTNRFGPVLTERGRKIADLFFMVLLVLMTGGMLLFLPAHLAYKAAKLQYPLLNTGTQSVVKLQQIGVEQSEALRHLAEASKNVLEQLDEAAAGLAQSKASVRSTLTSIENQAVHAAAAARDLDNLSKRHRQIEVQLAEISTLLHGDEPITKSDLERSGRQGLWLGAALGFCGSLAASAMFRLIERRYKALRQRARQDA